MFLDQFFETELPGAALQLRSTLIWIIVGLQAPGLFILVHLAFFWDHSQAAPAAVVNRVVAELVLLFITYAFGWAASVALLCWDRLVLESRDVLILGPMPVHAGVLVGTKVAAVMIFFGTACLLVETPVALLFGVMTGSRSGVVAVLTHFAGLLIATCGAGACAIAGVVALRGVAQWLPSERLRQLLGAAFQGCAATGILWIVLSLPSALTDPRPWMDAVGASGWLPTSWFLAVFERIVGVENDALITLSDRGLVAVIVLTLTGVALISLGYKRQMWTTAALARRRGRHIRSPLQAMAQWFAGPGAGRAAANFVLVTLTRSKDAHGILVGAYSLAMAFTVIGIQQSPVARDASPPLAVLGIPFLWAYCVAIAIRFSARRSSDSKAVWLWVAVTGGASTHQIDRGVRAAFAVFLVSRTAAASVLLIPLVGARAANVMLLACGVASALAQLVSITSRHIPFTQEYEPGDSNLKVWWPVYAIVFLVAVHLPAKVLALSWHSPGTQGVIAAGVFAAVALGELWMRERYAHAVPLGLPRLIEEDCEPISLFNIGRLDANR